MFRKKSLLALLTLCMVFGMAVPAFAAEIPLPSAFTTAARTTADIRKAGLTSAILIPAPAGSMRQ